MALRGSILNEEIRRKANREGSGLANVLEKEQNRKVERYRREQKQRQG